MKKFLVIALLLFALPAFAQTIDIQIESKTKGFSVGTTAYVSETATDRSLYQNKYGSHIGEMSVKSTFKANEKMTTTMSAIGKGSVLEKMGYMSSDECFDSAVGMFGQGDLEYDSQSELRPNKIEYNGKMKVIGGFRVGVVATTIGEDAYRKMEYHQRTLRGETDYSINITVKIN